MDVKIHTQGIKGSALMEEGEKPGALFGAIVELDGEILQNVFKAEFNFEEGFAELKLTLHPTAIEVVSHTKDSWPGILESYRERVVARDALGQAIAVKS